MVLECEADAAPPVAPRERGDRLPMASAGGPSGIAGGHRRAGDGATA